MSFVTPYAAHKFVNKALEDAKLAKRIPPQMMYNYTTGRLQKGKAPFIKFDEKKGVDQADLERWTKAYVEKQAALAAQQADEEDTPIEGLELQEA